MSLIFVIPLLVLLTGGLLTMMGASAGRDASNRLAAGVFDAVSVEAEARMQGRLRAAHPASDILAGQIASGTIETGDPEALVAALVPVLEANPAFTWISWSDTRGDLLGVYRQDEEVRLWVTRQELTEEDLPLTRAAIEDYHTAVPGARHFRLEPDGTWTFLRHRIDSKYDARVRPFFRTAVAAGKRSWTRPYIFYDPVTPGVTCAAPVYRDAGSLRGVLTVDFALTDLSRGLADLAPVGGGLVVLHTVEEPGHPALTLSHPTLAAISPATEDDPATLVPLARLLDPALLAYLRGERGRRGAPVRFEVPTAGDGPSRGTDPWLGETSELKIPGALPNADVNWEVTVLAPAAGFTTASDIATLRAALASGLLLVLALLVAFAFAELLSRPLRRVAASMERVGRFDLQSPVKSRSMFRELDGMGLTLKSLRGSLRSFARYVPEAVVRRQLATGVPAVPGGEQRPLSILFSDIAGFTSVAERTPPDALLPAMGAYFSLLVEGVDATGGTVDKFIGDALLAFWNAPDDDPEHAAHCVTAALAGRNALRLVGSDPSSPPLLQAFARTRFGIATGLALVGNVGTTDRLNYTVLGDTVNLAARLELINKAYGTEILVDGATAEAAPDAAVYCPVDTVAVKGRDGGVALFEPLATVAEATDNDRALAAAMTDALRHYTAGDFRAAAEGFRGALVIRPDRPAASVLLSRAEAFFDAGPPEPWDGIHRRITK